MRIGDTYIQYSKIITSLAALAYAAQVSITIVLACNVPEASDTLIEILKTTTGLFGLIFGCYTGNSVVEKVNTAKKSTEKILNTSATVKPPTLG